jgi:hypothetical protein
MSTQVRDTILAPKGYQQLTLTTNTATGLTVPSPARFASIVVETQDVRFRDDGTDPTASVGMIIEAGGSLWYNGNINAIKFIEVASGAVVNICYYA